MQKLICLHYQGPVARMTVHDVTDSLVNVGEEKGAGGGRERERELKPSEPKPELSSPVTLKMCYYWPLCFYD